MSNYQLSVKSYPSYKDSGVEWLGDMPEHWELKRLKDVSKIIDCKNRTPEYFDEGEYLVIRTSNVRDGRINLDNPSFTDKSNFVEWTKRGVPPEGSILFTREAPAGEVCLVPEGYKSCLGQRMMNFIPKNSNYSLYFLYYFLSQRIKLYLKTIASGSTVHHLRIPQVFDISVIVPPFSEQKLIALYLDTKTAQIDRKIDLLNQKATRYGKLKQSLINETVTRGLDKSVPMKDSGIEAIGKIPEHWEVKRLKDLSDIQNSNVDKKSYDDEITIKLCNYVDVYKNDFINSSLDFMLATATKPEIKRFQIKEGDVFITKDSETSDDIAVPALATESFKDVICGYHLARIRVKEKLFLGIYLFRLFQSKNYGFRFVISAKGITRVGLGQSVIADSLTPVPPLSEQKAIADYLDNKTAQIDQIIQTINTQIKKLKELRKTLINDVVTGKIRTRIETD